MKTVLSFDKENYIDFFVSVFEDGFACDWLNIKTDVYTYLKGSGYDINTLSIAEAIETYIFKENQTLVLCDSEDENLIWFLDKKKLENYDGSAITDEHRKKHYSYTVYSLINYTGDSIDASNLLQYILFDEVVYG